MAIVPAVPGLEVCIQSGAPTITTLPEHPDSGPWTYRKFSHLSHTRRSSVYVESKAGATFRIRLLLRYPFKLDSQSLTFKASVDGHGIAQASCSQDYFGVAGQFYMEVITARLDRVSSTEIESRVLRFGSLKKVDDNDSSRVKEDARALENTGNIVISVFRTLQRNQILPPPNALYTPSTYVPPEEVAEKALKGKAISHGVQYGDKEVITRHIKETVDVDGSDRPIAVFVFKYRSREDLKAEMIIPRSVSPEPVRSSGSGRAARLANLKREIADIKAEENEDVPRATKRSRSAIVDDDDDVQIIRSRAYKTSRTATGHTMVDLTEDDD